MQEEYFLENKDYELIYFEDFDKSFNEIKLKSQKSNKILLHFKDMIIDNKILAYLLKFFRYASKNSFNIYFIIKKSKYLDIYDFRAYFSIFESIEEYNKMKTYSNFEVKIYDDNPYFKNILKTELLKLGFKIKERNSNNFLNKNHNCDYTSIYIVDFDTFKNEKIEEVKKIRKINKECNIIAIISSEANLNLFEFMKYGINQVFKKPVKYDELLMNIKNVAFSINLKKENERLVEQIVEREKEISKIYNKLNNELKVASDIQKSLMPKEEILFKNYHLQYIYMPSMNIGGDFYDFIKLTENRFAVVFADISGHGIASSLLASMLKVLIYNHAKKVKSIVELMEILNEEIINIFPKGKFVSIFYLVIDVKKNNLRYCSATQESAILYDSNKDEIKLLKTKGQVLGIFSKKIFPQISFEEKTIDFNINDKLLLYTDGITEATNKENMYYGIERLISLVKDNDINQIKEDLANFVKKDSYEDDITLLSIKRIE